MDRKAQSPRDDFDYWVADMDDALERFIDGLPECMREQLDYSPASLDILESWILDTYPNTQEMLSKENVDLVDGAARYIGETFRKCIGGYWDIRLEDPKFVFYGLPILTGFKTTTTPECPLTLATAAANRRTGTYIRTVLEAYL